MKINYFIAYFCLIVFSNSVAANTCATLDNFLNLSLPCVNINDQYYSVNLNRFHNNENPYDFYWTLKDFSDAENNSNCSTINDSLDINIGCVSYQNLQYQLTLNYLVSNNLYNTLIWQLGSVQPIETSQNNTSLSCRDLMYSKSSVVKIVDSGIFPGIVHDGSQIVISYAQSNDLYLQSVSNQFLPTSQAVKVTQRANVTDHKHVFYQGYHYMLYSTLGDNDLFLIKLDSNYVQQGETVTVSKDSTTTRTNDMLLTIINDQIATGQYRPSDRNNGENGGHLIKLYDTELNKVGSDIVVNEYAHTNTAAIQQVNNLIYLLAPSIPKPGAISKTQRDLELLRFDIDWNLKDTTILSEYTNYQYDSDGDGIWMSTGIAYEQHSNCLFTGHTFVNGNSGSDHGQLYFRVYDQNLKETYSEIMVDSEYANRAHFLLEENTLFIVYDDSSSGKPVIYGLTYTIGQ